MLLIYLGVSVVAAFGLAVGLAVTGASPAAAAHAAFALGAMPLIFAAMGHFVPVLTRSGAAEKGVHFLPLALQLAGLLVVAALAGVLPGWNLHLAASIGIVAALGFLAWQWRRGRAALGRPHPGLAWYKAALGCLAVALVAILAGLLWPAAYAVLRLAHLHLNTLGFIGLAAIGTLHVLMPTALGQPDPQAAVRLRRQLPWALGGVAASAAAGLIPLLAVLGGLAIGGVLIHMLHGWWRTYGLARLLGDGAAVALSGATCGLLLVIAAGALHGMGGMLARPAIVGFFALFLLPLVTGALSQLLPVWRHPGPLTPQRTAMRARLVRFGGLRTALFLAGGGLLLGGVAAGAALLAAGIALFAGVLLHALLQRA
ncbi:MAG: hypothetical protein JSR69_09210 [Proteobacteria bacterium]|nr:hypothetical protein [Pseudomonadota bacterium]